MPLVRTSERSTFKRCRQQWYWSYVEQLAPLDEFPALRFGTLIHRAMETHFIKGKKRGPHPVIAFKKFYDAETRHRIEIGMKVEAAGEDEVGKDWVSGRDLGIAMLEGYIDKWGEADARYEVIASELSFAEPMFHPENGAEIGVYVGTLDLLLRDRQAARRRYLIRDFKTTSRLNTAHLRLDEQASAYWSFGVDALVEAGLLPEKERIDALEFDFLVKSMPDTRPVNELGQSLNLNGSVSKTQPAARYHREMVQRTWEERKEPMKRAAQEFIEMELVRRGALAVYKAPSPFTCPFCPHRGMCELHESGADWEEYRRLMYKLGQSYAPYAIENDEKL
jgi:hypothetical protein